MEKWKKLYVRGIITEAELRHYAIEYINSGTTADERYMRAVECDILYEEVGLYA